jgi:hypothetical protein
MEGQGDPGIICMGEISLTDFSGGGTADGTMKLIIIARTPLALINGAITPAPR